MTNGKSRSNFMKGLCNFFFIFLSTTLWVTQPGKYKIKHQQKLKKLLTWEPKPFYELLDTKVRFFRANFEILAICNRRKQIRLVMHTHTQNVWRHGQDVYISIKKLMSPVKTIPCNKNIRITKKILYIIEMLRLVFVVVWFMTDLFRIFSLNLVCLLQWLQGLLIARIGKDSVAVLKSLNKIKTFKSFNKNSAVQFSILM